MTGKIDDAGAEAVCLNCGMAVLGRHCHNCGQSVSVHRTLTAFWHDFTHSILHFEGKIWRTLPLLFFKPGQLTRRYVHGERARFVSPLVLFLFSVFLMFAAFNWIGKPISPDSETSRNGQVTGKAEMRAELVKAKAKATLLEKGHAPASAIEDAREDVRALETGVALADGTIPEGLEITDVENATDVRLINDAFKEAVKNPSLLAYKMQSNAYKYSWALIPISIPLVWLLFAFRREFKPYDHAIFVTYSLAFMSLLLVMMSVLSRLGPLGGLRGPLIVLAPPIHMFVQLRGAYGIGFFAAAWRTLALLGISFVVLALFGVMLLALGVSG